MQQPLLRHAPAFQLELRAHFIWCSFNALVVGVVPAVLLYSLVLHAWLHAWVAGVMALVFTPLMAWWGWREALPKAYQLLWDGQVWALRHDRQAEPLAGTITVLVDAQSWLLLRWCAPTQATQWLLLSRRQHAAQWHGLRCTLFAPGQRHSAPEQG